jgi:hypothetical protein
MKTLRSILSDIIEVIDTIEAFKASRQPTPRDYYVPKPEPESDQPVWEKAKQAIDALRNHQVIGYTKEESAEAAVCLARVMYTDEGWVAPQAGTEGEVQVNPEYTDAPADDHTITIGFVAQGDPEENAHQQSHATEEHQAAMFTPEAEEPTPEPEPEKKTRKPRTPKAPKPDPVDINAVRGEVATAISSLVEQGKKENIKELLAKFEADRAREIPDDKIVAFRDELILL